MAAAATQLQMTVKPNRIMIGAKYNGLPLVVTGTIPDDATALIRLRGDVEQSRLKQKGRVLGVLWMNQGAVEISNVPTVFLLFLPEGSGTAMGDGSPWSDLGLGMEAIGKQAEIESKEGDKGRSFCGIRKIERKGRPLWHCSGCHCL